MHFNTARFLWPVGDQINEVQNVLINDNNFKLHVFYL